MPYSNQYLAYIYSAKWKNKSKGCQQLTKSHCIIFPWLRTNHAHHLTYRNLKNEIPVRDIVPLSKIAHSIVHWSLFWKTPLRPLVNGILRFLMFLWIIIWSIF
jgi:hypothetical protein